MLRIPIALLGVNLTENENIFLGIFLKINSANEVLILVDNSPLFTDKVNKILESTKEHYKKSKDFASFFNTIRDISSTTRFMLYDKLMATSHDNPTVEMVVKLAKSTYMNVFANVNAIVKTKDEKPVEIKSADIKSVEAEEKPAKKQSKTKEDNK